MSELARRVGLGEYFTQDTDDYLRAMLNHPDQSGITLERLRAEGGLVRAKGAEKPLISFADKRFPTPSGRMEFYVEYLHSIGQALPDHLPPREAYGGGAAEPYPLQFFTGRRKFVNQSQSYQRTTRELNPVPYLRLNPTDAQARAIADDDWVRVYNPRGEFRVRAQLSEGIRPGTAWIEHGWWPRDFPHGHYQDLLPPLNLPTPDMLSPSFQVYWGMWREFAESAPSPGLAPYGLADQIFDVRVEVERLPEAAA
jgi:molybdopterin-containing oxidoreductase family molybdopterin binding subunit